MVVVKIRTKEGTIAFTVKIHGNCYDKMERDNYYKMKKVVLQVRHNGVSLCQEDQSNHKVKVIIINENHIERKPSTRMVLDFVYLKENR